MTVNRRKITSFFETNEVIFASSNSYSINLYGQNNYSYSLLIDTGASISAIKYKHVLEQNIPIHKQNISVIGIGGKVQSIGYVYLNFFCRNQVLAHKFYVFDSLPCKTSGIIGHDFLNKYKSVLNFGNKSLLLWNNNVNMTIPLNFIQKSITIPARSESIHFINTLETEESVICTSELKEGIFIASALVTPVNGTIPIRILNTTDKDLILDKINPIIQKANDYNICLFEKTNKNANRVKKLFSALNLNHLNKDEQASIEKICAKYSDIFYLEGDKLTTTEIYSHKIYLKDNVAPVYTKPYRLPVSQKMEINKQIDNLLEQGIIEHCNSEWSSPVLLVPKKSDLNGEKKWRLVIDYRKLNNCIQDDKFPLPNISEILDSLSGCVYFSHLDLNQGFYNVNLHKDSRKYTAFNSGQFQMTRMPMGLKTSPSSFSRMMTMAMAGLTYEKCLVYLDDLIVLGNSLINHNKNLIDVFERLRKVNLKLNPSKCNFLRKEMLYLGHVVSSEGVLPDPAKIEVIKNYPTPKTVEDVKRFVAFANYYRKFIPNFAEKSYDLNMLCRKNVKFKWDEHCQKSFDTLKSCMMKPPVLQYPDFSKENIFLLQTDASNYAVGAILSNGDGRPIAYASRNLNKAEKNYPTIEKELLAIVWAVKHFRPYLYGRSFKIMTDHKPLIYLFNLKDPSSRLLKFKLILEEYDYEIEYVKGRENVAADALSRLTITSKELQEMNENICVMTRAQTRKLNPVPSVDIVPTDDWSDQPRVVETHVEPKDTVELRFINTKELEKLRKENNILKETKTFIFVESKSTIFINPASRLQITRAEFARELSKLCSEISVNEIYFIKNKNNNLFVEKLASEIKSYKDWSGPRLIILKDVVRIEDKDDKKVVLNDFHLLPTSGHAGIRRMMNNIRKYYFWPGLEKDVKNYVKKCPDCQKQKYTIQVKEPMVITSTAHTAFEKIFLDLVGPLDKDNNNFSYILTIQCELSKYVCAYPLINKSASEVARCFVNNFVLHHGVPREIATDRGTEFMADTMKEVCNLLKIQKLNSTAYHHQSLGALENSHKSLAAYLRIQTEQNPEFWSSWLPFWCFAYNTSVNSSTKFTPFELVYGKKCTLPSNLTNSVEPLYNHDSYPLELKYRLQVSQAEARKNLISSKLVTKRRYDTYVNPVKYKPNDKLLVKSETGNKLTTLYLGPYKVIKDVSPNVEILINGKREIVHKNRTKPYYD